MFLRHSVSRRTINVESLRLLLQFRAEEVMGHLRVQSQYGADYQTGCYDDD